MSITKQQFFDQTTKFCWIFYFNFFASLIVLIAAPFSHMNLGGALSSQTETTLTLDRYAQIKADTFILPFGLEGILSTASTMAFIAFFIWAFKLVKVAKQQNWTSYSPSMAIISFMIPVANFFLPYLIFQKIWSALQKASKSYYPYTLLVTWIFYLITEYFQFPFMRLVSEEILQQFLDKTAVVRFSLDELLAANLSLIYSQIFDCLCILGIILLAQRVQKMLVNSMN